MVLLYSTFVDDAMQLARRFAAHVQLLCVLYVHDSIYQIHGDGDGGRRIQYLILPGNVRRTYWHRKFPFHRHGMAWHGTRCPPTPRARVHHPSRDSPFERFSPPRFYSPDYIHFPISDTPRSTSAPPGTLATLASRIQPESPIDKPS